METATLANFADLPTTYEGLCKWHLPRPISDDVAYESSLEVLEVMAGQTLNKEQSEYFGLLGNLVADWEDKHDEPLCKTTPESLLAHLLESNGLATKDLADLLGVGHSMACRILRGERGLTTCHIRTLSDRFKVKPELFF